MRAKISITTYKMKKFILFATGILLFLSAFTASAAAKTPDEILPDTVNIYMKADPSNINEVFSGYYEDMMNSLTNGMFYYSYYYIDETAELSEGYTETTENLAEIFATNPLYFAMEADYDIDGYLEPTIITFMFEISESEYEDDILTPYIEDNSVITEVNGVSIYAPEDVDGAVAYYEGYFLFADAAESIENLLNATTTLDENTDYTDISEKFLSGNFFEIYIGDIQILLDEFYGYDDFYETMVGVAAFESIGFSMKETATGYEFQSYVGQDAEVLSELNLDYDNMDPLSLQEHMPKSNPIFYTAKNNSADLISMIKNSYEYDYMAEELEDELHIDLDELVFALENETAFLVQDNGELFPTMTLLTKLEDNKDAIQEQVDQFVLSTWDNLFEDSDIQADDGTVTYYENDSTVKMKKDTVEIDGATLDQFVINVEPNVGKNPYALILAPSLLEFKITIGITSDDLLLISSSKDIVDTYNEGLENNSDLEDLFGSSTDAVTYLSATQINEYLQTTLTTLEKYLPEDFDDLTETKSVINTFLEPWDVLKGTDSITNDYIESKASILANIDKIITNYNLEKLMEEFEASENEDGAELIFSSPRDFSDIEGTEWYGDNVYYLTTKGIVDGHPDGTYKPTDTLNRAEFIKLVAETLYKEGLLEMSYDSYETPYSDIAAYEWYARYVNTLYDEGLLANLWENDTELNSNQDMTRIEAATLLSNVLNKYSIEAALQNADEISFIDMSSDNKAVIENVFQNNIMVGTSDVSFAPGKTLNRAEAASIIRNLLNIL
jgi:S-layer homology domain